MLGTNPKTGSKLLAREPVRMDKIKAAAYKFTAFLDKYNKTGKLDEYLYYEKDVKSAVELYVDANWETLTQEASAEETVAEADTLTVVKAA